MLRAIINDCRFAPTFCFAAKARAQSRRSAKHRMLYCLSSSRHGVPAVVGILQSVGEWLSLVEHLVRDTEEPKGTRISLIDSALLQHRDPDGSPLTLVPSLGPNSVVTAAPSPAAISL